MRRQLPQSVCRTVAGRLREVNDLGIHFGGYGGYELTTANYQVVEEKGAGR